MSCHISCATCASTAFDSCLTCPAGASLVNGGCFCSLEWDALCTYNVNFRGVYIALSSFYTVIFPLVIFLYYLKAKLPISYRIITGLQSLSLLIFSHKIYYYFQNQFGLRLLSLSNGYYNFTNRLEPVSVNYAIGPFVIMGCFIVVFVFGYHLTLVFRRKGWEYCEYLCENVKHMINCIYFFGSRMMFLFMGLWIKNVTTAPGVFIPFVIFSFFIVATLLKLFYDFHKSNLQSDEVYEPQILLYCMLSSASVIGIPLVQNHIFYIAIFLVPLGLLVLIMLLNKNYQIFTKAKIWFYMMEILIAGLSIAFVLVADPYRSYILLIGIVIGTAAMVIELIYVYNSGFDLSPSGKVHPQPLEFQSKDEPKYKTMKRSVKTTQISKNTYF